ncbi:hypothetical protein T484DRAFT_1959095, partial [Baffinella frigidus]
TKAMSRTDTESVPNLSRRRTRQCRTTHVSPWLSPKRTPMVSWVASLSAIPNSAAITALVTWTGLPAPTSTRELRMYSGSIAPVSRSPASSAWPSKAGTRAADACALFPLSSPAGDRCGGTASLPARFSSFVWLARSESRRAHPSRLSAAPSASSTPFSRTSAREPPSPCETAPPRVWDGVVSRQAAASAPTPGMISKGTIWSEGCRTSHPPNGSYAPTPRAARNVLPPPPAAPPPHTSPAVRVYPPCSSRVRSAWRFLRSPVPGAALIRRRENAPPHCRRLARSSGRGS